MYLLDSDISIWILRQHELITEFVKSLALKDEVAISTVTVAEIYKNMFPSELSITEDFLADHEAILVSSEIGKEAGYYWQQFHKKAITLSIIDCIIAATAKIQNATLVTLNTKHFPMDDIKVVSPAKLSPKR